MIKLLVELFIGSIIAIYFAMLILLISDGLTYMVIIFLPSAGLLGKTLFDLTGVNHTS